MHGHLLILASVFVSVNSVYTYEYEESAPRQLNAKFGDQDNEDEIEPVNTLKSHMNKTTINSKNILCEDYEEYAANCTYQARLIYNSTKKPPLSHELNSWCSALKFLTNCEYDWNTDCKDVTDKIFQEETIKGQLHVLDRICHDDWISVHYDALLNTCIRAISDDWKKCYEALILQTDERKNSSKSWTHYESHFYMCCARTRFRRCTLEVLLNFQHNCTGDQSLLMQKFSSIVSEGEVFQDCNFNMVYADCPGGDPRPPLEMVSRMMGDEEPLTVDGASCGSRTISFLNVALILLNYSVQ